MLSTTQTWEPHVLNYIRNYLASTPCLVDKAVLLDPWFVWKHHGWDPVDILIRLVNDRGGPSKVKLCSLTYHLLNLSTSNSTCKYEHWTAYVHLARFLQRVSLQLREIKRGWLWVSHLRYIFQKLTYSRLLLLHSGSCWNYVGRQRRDNEQAGRKLFLDLRNSDKKVKNLTARKGYCKKSVTVIVQKKTFAKCLDSTRTFLSLTRLYPMATTIHLAHKTSKQCAAYARWFRLQNLILRNQTG